MMLRYVLFLHFLVFVSQSNGATPKFRSATDFTASLYDELGEPYAGDRLVSSLSLSSALQIYRQAINGDVAKRIAWLLRLPDKEQSAIKYRHFLWNNRKMNIDTLNVANVIFAPKSVNISRKFEETVRRNYRTKIIRYEPGQQVNYVPGWFGNRTNQQLQNLNLPELIGNEVIFLNSVNFKSFLLKNFTMNYKDLEIFHGLSGDKYIPMLHSGEEVFNYKYSSELNSHVIELPGHNTTVTMFVIIPKPIPPIQEKKLLKNVEIKIRKNYLLNVALSYLKPVLLNVVIPPFSINAHFRLNDYLAMSGIRKVMKKHKINIGAEEDMKIKDVFQYLAVNVKEDVMEASGGTQISARSSLVKTIKATRPFLFILYDTLSRNILFQGKFTNQP